MRDVFELYEFFVEGKDSLYSHVLLHISEPNIGDHAKGYLFAICEIENGSIEQIQQLQDIIDDIEAAYYDNSNSDEQEKDSFESTIEFMNRRSADILSRKGVVHCFIGVVRGKELVFTTHGEPHAHVSYRKDGKWKHINLVREETQDDKQLFDSVIQGQVATGDYIFVSTPSVAKHFSPDRLEKLFSTRSTKESAEHIQRTLSSLKSDDSFGGMLIYSPFNHEIPKTGKQVKTTDKGSEDSLNNFLSKQQHTEEILSPLLFSHATKRLKGMFSKKEQERQRRQSPRTETNYRPRKKIEPKGPLAEQILITLGKGLFMGCMAIALFLKQILLGIWHSLLGLFFIITNYHNKRQQILGNISERFRRKKQWFSHLPMMSKVLLLIAIIFFVSFAGSISYMRHQEALQMAAQQHAELLQAIKDKKDAAEASLIYNDRQKALRLLQEANALIEDLPTQTPEQQTQKQQRTDEIETLLLSLRKITDVDARTISTLPVSNGITMDSLAYIDNKLIVFDNDQQEYFEVDATTGDVTAKQDQAANALIRASTPKENDKIVFLNNNNNIAEYDKSAGGIVSKEIRFPNENSDITDLFVYNRRLYTLDPINNQIYRHNQTQTGYDQGTPWVQDSTAKIDNGISLAIDGDIYVLESTGRIVKFTAGVEQSFNISGLDPILEAPTQLWTYNDSNYIYILEPLNKRIVVLTKDGLLHNQYTHESWQNPQAMIVDIDKRKIFLLDNNTLYEFDITL